MSNFTRMIRLACWATPLAALAAEAAPARPVRHFEYDPADVTVPATAVDGDLLYDADVQLAASSDDLWLTWLQFEPGVGDHLWIGRRHGNTWTVRRELSDAAGCYADPALTLATDGTLWLSVEVGRAMAGTADHFDWKIALYPLTDEGAPAQSPLSVTGIAHRCIAAPDGSLWMTWQQPRDGHFDIMSARITRDGIGDVAVVNDSPAGGWQPDVAVEPDDTLHVVWDAFDGESYNVYLRSRRSDGTWQQVIPVTDSPSFEGRARILTGAGRTWILWEEGAPNWGKPYRARMLNPTPDKIDLADRQGPLHRYRRLRVAQLEGDRLVRLPDLPMPAFDTLAARTNVFKGVKDLGGFYERGELALDEAGRPWVAYRHYYLPWLGTAKISHQQEDWGIYARCFDGRAWSKLYRFDAGQGDGMQRLSVKGGRDGLFAAITIGRTDRRPDRTSAPGIVFARFTGAETRDTPAAPATDASSDLPQTSNGHRAAAADGSPRPQTTVAGTSYHLFYGDLHRHSDLSLCYVPLDGTLDDNYRYAIDVARLDFLGMTDHCRDIAMGDAKSLLWWRCRKEVTWHELSPRFYPMFAYERSRDAEDHNVISLRADMLRTFTYPHPDFWKELDNDTFTIPHQTMAKPIPPSGEMPLGLTPATWDARDDVHRPLMEIYQGCRDRAIEPDARLGLSRGHIFGFIASSDHLSTSAGYAGVWSADTSREGIFRAMQHRRTFAATDRIALIVTAGEQWMGEVIEPPSSTPMTLHIQATGTADITHVELIADGQIQPIAEPHSTTIDLHHALPAWTQGMHYAYVRLRQSDGNQAWSSPVWVRR